jgi:hypothetical protein
MALLCASTPTLVQFAASFDAQLTKYHSSNRSQLKFKLVQVMACGHSMNAVYGVMMNDYYTGWFDPEDDEIPESALQPIVDRLTAK